VTLLAGALDSLAEAGQRLAASATLPSMDMASAPTTSLGDGEVPIDAARCARSLRLAVAPARGLVAVWWTRATGGRVHLAAAWRDSVRSEGRLGAWRGPIMVDTLDRGPRDAQAADRGAYGCARPAPSLAVDRLNGYVHVAYALTGPEGPGVFYAHQMDPRAAFEPPVAVLYGERLGQARVASHGELGAVAYEDPNSRARVTTAVAISARPAISSRSASRRAAGPRRAIRTWRCAARRWWSGGATSPHPMRNPCSRFVAPW